MSFYRLASCSVVRRAGTGMFGPCDSFSSFQPVAAKLQIDHIKPKSNNGEYAINNLITACFECNSGKRDVILSERERIKLKSITRTS